MTPAVNQIELHPYLLNDEVRAYGEAHGILTEAWSPIAQGGVLDDPVITAIADKLGTLTGPGRAALAHPAPAASCSPSRPLRPGSQENFELFDFELQPDEIVRDRGARQG